MGHDRVVNAAEHLLHAAPPARTALACGDRTLSYSELCVASAHAAWLWQDCEAEPGETVIVRLAPGFEQAAALLGAIWAGAVPLSVPPTLPAAAWLAWAAQAGCRFVLDLSREGHATRWRDQVITLAEWRVGLSEARAVPAVHLHPTAPACWADLRGGAPAAALRHGALATHKPEAAAAPRQLRARGALGLLLGLRRGGTVHLTSPSAARNPRPQRRHAWALP